MLQETLWLYSGYQEQLGASGMQIQYNYVTLYTKTILRNAFSFLMHILFTQCSDSIEVATSYQSRLLAPS